MLLIQHTNYEVIIYLHMPHSPILFIDVQAVQCANAKDDSNQDINGWILS